ncbi:MAG: YggS family pyridoxal phosphate-dependent enzyme [Spirochaetes bacterium]|nr:MAG: YggS family pyridoxal phosphate-dependent enzyme [Spirochaetota bacterium]
MERDSIESNIRRIESRIKEAAERAGRNAEGIRLMAVTKTRIREEIIAAYRAGISLFGENRVAEAEEKYKDLGIDIELHMIGHLQRNKAKTAAGLFKCVQSIDKLETAEVLNKYLETLNKKMDILFEINTSGEESKYGFRDKNEYFRVLERVNQLSMINIRGLMTIGPFTDNEQMIRDSFRFLRELYEETRSRYQFLEIDTLSMGMSSDFEIAVEEGATLLRIGSSIFGSRRTG